MIALRKILKLALLFILLLPSFLSTESSAQSPIGNVDQNGVAIMGYDPVAYFTLGKPTKGAKDYQATWAGLTYHFANAEHLELFQANPETYVPSYGGYCAFGMRYGNRSRIDPNAWEIVDGRLHLLLNHGTMVMWQRKTKENIEIADKNWGLLADQDD